MERAPSWSTPLKRKVGGPTPPLPSAIHQASSHVSGDVRFILGTRPLVLCSPCRPLLAVPWCTPGARPTLVVDALNPRRPGSRVYVDRSTKHGTDNRQWPCTAGGNYT